MIAATIDGNYMLHRCMRAGDLGTLTNRNGVPTGGTYGFLKSLQSVISANSVNNCTVVFDAGISVRRRSIYPGYKGARWRDDPSDPFYEEPTQDRLDFYSDFDSQQDDLISILANLGVRVVKLDGWEGDDVAFRVATLHTDASLSYIVSDDKDFLQVPCDYSDRSVQVIRPIAGQIVNEGNFLDTIGYPQEEFFIRKSVEGDSSDKIPGVEGVGSGTLTKIFNEGAPVGHYPYEEFIIWCSDHKSKRVRAIADQMDILVRNVELIDLTMEEYPDSIAKHVDSLVKSDINVDIAGVDSVLTELDMFSITKNLHWWITPFQRLR